MDSAVGARCDGACAVVCAVEYALVVLLYPLIRDLYLIFYVFLNKLLGKGICTYNIELIKRVMIMIKMRIGPLIKDSGLKRKYICSKLKISPDTLKNWEVGKSYPRLDQSVHLADILGCSVTDLYYREP